MASGEGGLAAAAAVAAHPATTAEVRALCADLQVLGRSEFKQLLKWCALAPAPACLLCVCAVAISSPAAARQGGSTAMHLVLTGVCIGPLLFRQSLCASKS